MRTLREKIKSLLMKTKVPLTVNEIALELDIRRDNVKEVYEHLKHIAKTVRRESKGKLMLYMVPPMCRSCGYVFKSIDKPKKPSKCPKCGSQRIDPPKFIISEA